MADLLKISGQIASDTARAGGYLVEHSLRNSFKTIQKIAELYLNYRRYGSPFLNPWQNPQQEPNFHRAPWWSFDRNDNDPLQSKRDEIFKETGIHIRPDKQNQSLGNSQQQSKLIGPFAKRDQERSEAFRIIAEKKAQNLPITDRDFQKLQSSLSWHPAENFFKKHNAGSWLEKVGKALDQIPKALEHADTPENIRRIRNIMTR